MADLISREKLLEDIRCYQMDMSAKATAIHCIEEQKKLSTMTDEEVWKVAIKVSELSPKKRAEIFKIEDAYTGDILKEFPPLTAKTLIEVWEEKNLIESMDVVIVKNTKEKALVIYANEEKDMYKCLFLDGDINTYKRNDLEKIGRKIDFEKVLEGTDE